MPPKESFHEQLTNAIAGLRRDLTELLGNAVTTLKSELVGMIEAVKTETMSTIQIAMK